MTDQFFHANDMNGVNVRENAEPNQATPTFVSPNLSSKNTVPINDLAKTIYDHLIDQNVFTSDA